MSGQTIVKPMKWPGFQPICHAFGCKNDAKWHVFFPYYEEYRCDDHKPDVALARFTDHKETTDYHEGQHEADDTSNRRQDGGSRDSGGEGDGDVPAENPSPPVSELDLRRRARVVANGSVLFERKGPEAPS